MSPTSSSNKWLFYLGLLILLAAVIPLALLLTVLVG